ncbi:uroporphyrinogen-III C-methyltransferase [Stratiformator vulcanicus]|uniref:uroporphyrinogen-III C-methyltransferase n=1 Tax=Stratiformator vulcanicus TaxID=2527980 RepID=A0A517QX72_9PLAN|nr:uroporphyrinogen-III C-methyltransferase [Stratiformator vulcanicus]QDT36204.1 Uroporphyrinogen-III C-methyltransferase [Stratiformator vulcanicus]
MPDKSSTQSGRVYIVGGGPGDPRLISVRGVECLREADLVLYDTLVSPLLLRHTKAQCEHAGRESGPGGPRVNQDEINQRLISEAKAGKIVVRLKGGDPFIFGRGSEEAAALAAEAIPYEIVPGITAAVAAAEYAGISLTHRKHASSVAFVTGHEDPTKPDSSLDYQQLATWPGTLVFYMGLHRLTQISSELIRHGMAAETPACVISRGAQALQQTVTSSLSTIAEAARNAKLVAPSLTIIGDCVRQREAICWFEQKTLFGTRIGITRPDGQADGAINQALELGAEPIVMPMIEIGPPADWAPVDEAIKKLPEFDWLIFTSANGVQYFLDRLRTRDYDARRLAGLKIAAIGPATAAALTAYCLTADLVPDEYRAEALAGALEPEAAGRRVLWAGADRGREVLIDRLTSAGADVTKVATYRNVDADRFPADAARLLRAGKIHWIGLSSPSIARNFANLLDDEMRSHLGQTVRLATISPVTTAAAKEVGIPVAAEATTYTWDGIFSALQRA